MGSQSAAVQSPPQVNSCRPTASEVKAQQQSFFLARAVRAMPQSQQILRCGRAPYICSAIERGGDDSLAREEGGEDSQMCKENNQFPDAVPMPGRCHYGVYVSRGKISKHSANGRKPPAKIAQPLTAPALLCPRKVFGVCHHLSSCAVRKASQPLPHAHRPTARTSEGHRRGSTSHCHTSLGTRSTSASYTQMCTHTFSNEHWSTA